MTSAVDRCLVVCKSLGIFATAHADGKLYLRALPDLEAGGGPTVTIGEQPVKTLSNGPAAIIQARVHPAFLTCVCPKFTAMGISASKDDTLYLHTQTPMRCSVQVLFITCLLP